MFNIRPATVLLLASLAIVSRQIIAADTNSVTVQKEWRYLAGEWGSSFGKTQISIDGSTIEGHYQSANGIGHFKGAIDDTGVIQWHWEEPKMGAAGKAKLKVIDENELAGTWGNQNSENDGSWKLWRTHALPVSPPAASGEDLPTLNAPPKKSLAIEVDGVSWGGWMASGTEAWPDTLDVDVPDGKTRKVRFASDDGSISFTVEAEKHYDFLIVQEGVSNYTRVAGHAFNPDFLRVTRISTGNTADVNPKVHGPVLNLDGGGERNIGMQKMIDEVRGCTDCDTKVDVVVLAATNYNPSGPFAYAAGLDKRWEDTFAFYKTSIAPLNGVDSVEVMFFKDSRSADDPEVAQAVSRAEVVFFAGGAQCEYLKIFRGTQVLQAVKDVYTRGGAVGGSSAGEAIQGKFIYESCEGSATTKAALANPYDATMSFAYDIFSWRYLENTITDQHVVARKRLGRTFAFVARQLQDGKARRVQAIAVDETAAVLVDKKGLATVQGAGPAYFILGDHKPEICKPDTPLTFSNIKVWKVLPGGVFNLKHWPKNGFYTVDVDQGKLSRDPY